MCSGGNTIEEVLLVTGEQVGHENIIYASRMNKAVVIFLKNEKLVNRLIESGVWLKESFLSITPLHAPATKVTISNVPPFVKDDAIIRELTQRGKMANAVKTIPLGCKFSKLNMYCLSDGKFSCFCHLLLKRWMFNFEWRVERSLTWFMRVLIICTVLISISATIFFPALMNNELRNLQGLQVCQIRIVRWM